MKNAATLSKTEKESIGLLQIGTFLEYFDFTLYVHMAVILNDVFFPKTDTYSKALLASFAFSMAYIVRPIGSFIFGILGDFWGRKSNIIMTTMMMSVSSFFLACMPTYAQIGFKASIGVIGCRIIQGISSAVEVVGAKIYLAESTKAPKSYFYCGLISVSIYAGGFVALSLCSFMMFIRPDDGWRYVFFLGSGIAVIGSMARTRLKESPEFLNALKKANVTKRKALTIVEAFRVSKRNVISYLMIEMLSPILVFVSFFYSGEFLAKNYGYEPKQIIFHNTLISLVGFTSTTFIAFLTKLFFPIKMLRFSALTLLCVLPFVPSLIHGSSSVWQIFAVQAFLFSIDLSVGAAVFVRGVPTIGRYTVLGTSFSLARAIGAVFTSFICVMLGEKFGFTGVACLLGFMACLYLLGLHLFVPCEEDQRIEKEYYCKKRFRFFPALFPQEQKNIN